MSSPRTARAGLGASAATYISHGTAPFIATFVAIHLTAPILANLGGSSLASQVMILGREYYQTPFGEKALVIAPIFLHVSSSLAKRLLYTPPAQPAEPNLSYTDPDPAPAGKTRGPRRIRPLTSLITLTGYALVPLLLVHFFTHRRLPASPKPPIFAVGPAELDFEFVKAGLARWPVRSWLLYAGLVGGVALHSMEGLNIISRMWMGGQIMKRRARRIASALLALPALSGVWVMSREPLMTFADVGERYIAALRQHWVYRL